MISKFEGLPENVAAFRASGEVTREDYEKTLIPMVEDKLENHEKIRLLYHLGPDFKGFTAGAMWDDTKVGLKHLKAWEKVAMVTDVSWLRNTVKCLGFIIPGKVKIFHNAEMDQAKDWVSSNN